MTMVKVRLPPAVMGLPGTRGPFPKFSGGHHPLPRQHGFPSTSARRIEEIVRHDLEKSLFLSSDFAQSSRALQPRRETRSHGNTTELNNTAASSTPP